MVFSGSIKGYTADTVLGRRLYIHFVQNSKGSSNPGPLKLKPSSLKHTV